MPLKPTTLIFCGEDVVEAQKLALSLRAPTNIVILCSASRYITDKMPCATVIIMSDVTAVARAAVLHIYPFAKSVKNAAKAKAVPVVSRPVLKFPRSAV